MPDTAPTVPVVSDSLNVDCPNYLATSSQSFANRRMMLYVVSGFGISALQRAYGSSSSMYGQRLDISGTGRWPGAVQRYGLP